MMDEYCHSRVGLLVNYWDDVKHPPVLIKLYPADNKHWHYWRISPISANCRANNEGTKSQSGPVFDAIRRGADSILRKDFTLLSVYFHRAISPRKCWFLQIYFSTFLFGTLYIFIYLYTLNFSVNFLFKKYSFKGKKNANSARI